MRRLVVSLALSVGLMTSGAVSAYADETAPEPVPGPAEPELANTEDLNAPMRAFTTEGLVDKQCMGPAFAPSSKDVAVARNLLNGYVSIETFKTWRMPMTGGKVDLVKLTWREDPFDNPNWAFNLHTLRFADPLRRVGAGGGEGVSDADRAAMLDLYRGLLDDWIRNNPRNNPRSKFSWYDMAVGVRSIGLVCATTVVDADPALEGRLKASMATHAASLMNPKEYRVVGNHALHQNMGLLALGCHSGTDAWKDLALSRSKTLLMRSVDSQGVTDEGSILYQELNYRWYTELRTRIEACDIVPDPYFSNVDKMPDLLAQATGPEGTVVAFGDTSAKKKTQKIPGTVVEYAATQGMSGPKPAQPLFALFNRGYAFSRTGWYDTQPGTYTQSLAALRYGPGLSHNVHGQEDAGNISYFALGKQILWQPGVWGGAGGKPRKYVVSNQSHNTIDIPATSYDRGAVTTKSVTRSYPENTRDGAADLINVRTKALRGAVWKRTMIHAKQANFLIVDDYVTQKKSRTVEQHWNFGADRALKTSKGRAYTSGSGSNSVTLWVGKSPKLTVVRGQKSPMLGWRSESVNTFIKTPMAVASKKGRTVQMTAIIVPRPSNVSAKAIRIIRSSKSGSKQIVYVGVGAKTYRVEFSSSFANVTLR